MQATNLVLQAFNSEEGLLHVPCVHFMALKWVEAAGTVSYRLYCPSDMDEPELCLEKHWHRVRLKMQMVDQLLIFHWSR